MFWSPLWLLLSITNCILANILFSHFRMQSEDAFIMITIINHQHYNHYHHRNPSHHPNHHHHHHHHLTNWKHCWYVRIWEQSQGVRWACSQSTLVQFLIITDYCDCQCDDDNDENDNDCDDEDESLLTLSHLNHQLLSPSSDRAIATRLITSETTNVRVTILELWNIT